MTAIDFAFAVWETFYITILSTAFALVLGLPLGVLLVAGDKDGVLPLPGWLMHALNIVINILRSVPFLILMICVFPLSRLIVGTTVGTNATIVPLVVASFPFVARLVETSLRELDAGVIEAAQSMGATPFQIITKVMIPESLPSLISSMTTALRRRRPGQDCHLLRLLPLPGRHHADRCRPADHSGPAVPDGGHSPVQPQRQAPAQINTIHL